MSRLPGGWRRWAIATGVAVALIVGVVIARPAFRSYTGTAPPDQFFRAVQITPSLAARYPAVLGVAHNAGNNLGTLATALRYGADVIEIDVISAHGRLVAGREQPWPWLAEHVFRGPTLQQAWDAAADAPVTKLDLKSSEPSFLAQVVAFLSTRVKDRRVMISSPDVDALVYLHRELPTVQLLFSVSHPPAVDTLTSNLALQEVISGVSMFAGLVTPSVVRWAHERNLIVIAWTVNDGDELNRLVALGADGITTANLAILSALR
ncbi:MAG TPA: glycerophosphodiester phosphodiesterase [Mycobacteriales bacterium]|nr:glycerophosphodiester phosphodiesterase [Mycobacteriales bacterium]